MTSGFSSTPRRGGDTPFDFAFSMAIACRSGCRIHGPRNAGGLRTGVQADRGLCFSFGQSRNARRLCAPPAGAPAWPGARPISPSAPAPSVRSARLRRRQAGRSFGLYGLLDFDKFRREETDWLRPRWRPRVSQGHLAGAGTSYSVLPEPCHGDRDQRHEQRECQPCDPGHAQESWRILGRLAQEGRPRPLRPHPHPRLSPARTVGTPYPVVVGVGEDKHGDRDDPEADRSRLKLRVLDRHGKEVFPPSRKSADLPRSVEPQV